MSLHEMDKRLSEINSTEKNVIERLKASSSAILQVMSMLRNISSVINLAAKLTNEKR